LNMSSIEPTPEKPALFTRTSMRPKRSTAAAPTSWALTWSVTSSRCARRRSGIRDARSSS
jgi:hypothetical protein